MRPQLFKYQAGLAVIGAFTLFLCIFVLFQAGDVKQDNATLKTASDIAQKLNDYTSNQQSIPDSLSAVGARDIPAAISYHRLSDTSYQFCVTFKAAAGDTNALRLLEDAASRSTNSEATYDSGNSSLYISSVHKKGENCQTVTPYVYNYSGASNQTDTFNLN